MTQHVDLSRVVIERRTDYASRLRDDRELLSQIKAEKVAVRARLRDLGRAQRVVSLRIKRTEKMIVDAQMRGERNTFPAQNYTETVSLSSQTVASDTRTGNDVLLSEDTRDPDLDFEEALAKLGLD